MIQEKPYEHALSQLPGAMLLPEKRTAAVLIGHQLLIARTGWCRVSEPFFPVLLVLAVRSFKENHARIALVGYYMRSDTVEEPTVVGDDNGTTGEILQTPPLFSAKKIAGTRAYELARAGEEVEMRKALIHIYEMELMEYDMPRIRIRVRCSKGTYIRALAREIGEALHSGAHLTSLRRIRSGGFTTEQAWELEKFLEKLQALETK